MNAVIPPSEDVDQPENAQDRTSERLNFFLGTVLTSAPRGELSARVRNLSGGGMMVELVDEPDPEFVLGERLEAQLRNIGRVKGEVAWVDGRRLGVKFDRPIDPEAARKPVTKGTGTPDYAKPILVPDRALKNPKGPGTLR